MSDITVKMGFVDVYNEDGKAKKEMAIGIMPITLRPNPPIFAIPLSSAWLYNEPEYMARATRNIAEYLGMFPDVFLMKRIAGLILDYLPDLIGSKPFITDSIGSECGEGKMIDGDVIEHFAITTNGSVIR